MDNILKFRNTQSYQDALPSLRNKAQFMWLDENGGKVLKDGGLNALNEDEASSALDDIDSFTTEIYNSLKYSVSSFGHGTRSFKDAVKYSIDTKTFGSTFSPAIELFIADYIRPQAILSKYLAVDIPVRGGLSQSVLATIQAMGGPTRLKEVGKGEPLPTFTPSMSRNTETMMLDIKRYGIKVPIEKELLDNDELGIIAMMFSVIGDSFLRRKEYEVLKTVNLTGKTLYDNATPSAGAFGVTTEGRDIANVLNGTLTYSDIVRSMSYASARGINIQYMLIHPFTLWQMTGDSDLQRILKGSKLIGANGINNAGWSHPFGELGPQWRFYGGDGAGTFPPSKLNGIGEIGTAALLGVDPSQETLFTGNSYGAYNANIEGIGSIVVLVSPEVPIKEVNVGGHTKVASNIYLVGDKKPAGILMKQPVTMLEWQDIEQETSYTGFVEKYTTLPLYQGRQVFALRNIVLDKNYKYEGRFNIAGPVEPGNAGIVI